MRNMTTTNKELPLAFFAVILVLTFVGGIAAGIVFKDSSVQDYYQHNGLETPRDYCIAEGYTGSAGEQFADMSNNIEYAKCYKYTWEGPFKQNQYDIEYGWVTME